VAGFCKSGNSPDDWFVTGYRQSSSSLSSLPLRTLVAFLAVVPPLLSAVERRTAHLAQPHFWILFFSLAETIVEGDLFSSVESLSDFLFWCSVFSWFLFQNPKTGGGKNA
jgi:hypothetical protein